MTAEKAQLYVLRGKSIIATDDINYWIAGLERNEHKNRRQHFALKRQPRYRPKSQGPKSLIVHTRFLGVEHQGQLFQTIAYVKNKKMLITQGADDWAEAMNLHKKALRHVRIRGHRWLKII